MATTKVKPPTDDKFADQDVDLFEIMAAIDRKDYGYYDSLTYEQQKKVTLFNMVKWISSIQGKPDLQNFYLQSVNYHANTHLVNGIVAKHPRLLWLMLCASSPGAGVQHHVWIPHLKAKQVALKEVVTPLEARTYFKKLYPKAGDGDIGEIAKEFVRGNKRKVRLAQIYPNLKLTDIAVLNGIVSDEELKKYEQDLGN